MGSTSENLPLSRGFYRLLCLVTAAANCLGNAFLVVFYRPLMTWLGVPLPADPYTFTCVAGLSFTMGVLAFLVFLNPEKNLNMLIVGIVGKGIFAAVTLYFYEFHNLSWFWLAFGLWDGLYTVIFFLFLIQLLSPDLTALNRGDINIGIDRPRTNMALMLVFSLTGQGKKGMDRIRAGLERRGYRVDVKHIEADESIYRFPMSFWDFVRIIARAFVRWPARIRPLGIPADHPYDLIVVETQTWLVGMGAPMEAVFQDPSSRAIFRERDVAVLNVARGAWRRSQAMVVRWVQNAGGNVVGVQAHTHVGWEPSRLCSLWFYLIYHVAGQPWWLDGFPQKHYGISDESLEQLERFGEDLAERKRVRWHAAAAAVV